jgi:hypothetical protein
VNWSSHLGDLLFLGPYVFTGISLFVAAEVYLSQAEHEIATKDRIPQKNNVSPVPEGTARGGLAAASATRPAP